MSTRSRIILSVRGSRWRFADDTIVRESRLEIRDAGAGVLAALACSPEHLEELTLGFLYTHGAITGLGSVDEITLETGPDGEPAAMVRFASGDMGDQARRALDETRFVVSGCGQSQTVDAPHQSPSTSWPTVVSPATIAHVARLIQDASPVFAATGGVHASALLQLDESSGETPDALPRLLVVREDIGRHNTVDKIVGWCLAQKVGPTGTVIAVTGRVSTDLVHKAAAFGWEIVISRSAPTEKAIDLAEEAGMTLIGFARHDRFNVYSNWWRVAPLP